MPKAKKGGVKEMWKGWKPPTDFKGGGKASVLPKNWKPPTEALGGRGRKKGKHGKFSFKSFKSPFTNFKPPTEMFNGKKKRGKK